MGSPYMIICKRGVEYEFFLLGHRGLSSFIAFNNFMFYLLTEQKYWNINNLPS